jgi:uncharacterized membrane protein YjjP (DUF1212 family)
MPQAARAQSHDHLPRISLNSDGKRHPLQNSLTAFTFLAGIVAFATGLIVRDHVLATIVGGLGFVVGLYAQMISATREQRVFIVAGIIASFVGLGLAVAHGGFG